MPVMTDVRSVAANATVENVIAGKLHEFITEPSTLNFLATASAIGLNMSILVGGESLVQDQEISGINRFPQDPEDALAQGGGLPGDRILVSVRNTTGAAITSNLRINVLPAV